MENQIFTQRSQIEAWLRKMRIKHYSIAADFSVSAEDTVNLTRQNLDFIPVQFSIIKGHFSCEYNNLTSLKGCPHTVWQGFNASYNRLTSLEFGPQTVGTGYFVARNQLQSLKHAPQIIPGTFAVAENRLSSLEHGPVEVEDFYLCQSNLINTMLFCPKRVGGDIAVKNNPVSFSKDVINFQELKDRHLVELAVYQEKEQLSQWVQQEAAAFSNTKLNSTILKI